MVCTGLLASVIVTDSDTSRPHRPGPGKPGVERARAAHSDDRARCAGYRVGPCLGGRRVVSLRGEHDCASATELTAALADVIALDGADLIADLHDVIFMDASTVGALVRTQRTLGEQGRALALRAPSRSARRILEICELSGLVQRAPVTWLLPGTSAVSPAAAEARS